MNREPPTVGEPQAIQGVNPHPSIVPSTEEDAFAFDADLERSLLAGLSEATEESPAGPDGPGFEPDRVFEAPPPEEGLDPAGADSDPALPLLGERTGSPFTTRSEPARRGTHPLPGKAAPAEVSRLLDGLLGPPTGTRPEAPDDDAPLEPAVPEAVLVPWPERGAAPEDDEAAPALNPEEGVAVESFAPEFPSEPVAETDHGAREEAAGYSPVWLAEWTSPAAAADPELEYTLRQELSGSAPVAAAQDEPPPLEPSFEPSSEDPPDSVEPAASDHPRLDLETDSHAFEEVAAEPAAGPDSVAIAFATDRESEGALREGFSDHPNSLVWPGGLHEAIATLGSGQSSPLLFVDLDGTDYPAGAIHELATVCEVGTVVVAFGSNDSARFSREVLLAGVSDYLVKPITAHAVREAAARVASSARSGSTGGWSVGFAGTGGSGVSTLAAATALVAASQGRYVSVLDLNRTFPALAFLLDVEPAPGLVEVLSTVARASLHPEMVDGVRAQHSDRIAVYGYPWSASPPPPPPVWAICEFLVELQRRSHLVIIDGLDDAATRISLLAMVDTRVLVVEPTAAGAATAARVLARFDPIFDPDWPLLLVQNHTRNFKPRTGTRALRSAGVAIEPDVVIPFEPSLPAVTDRGWPEGRLPKSLRKPVAALVDRIHAASNVLPAVA